MKDSAALVNRHHDLLRLENVGGGGLNRLISPSTFMKLNQNMSRKTEKIFFFFFLN